VTCGSRLVQVFHGTVGGKWFKTCDLTLAHAARKGALVPQRGGWYHPAKWCDLWAMGNLARLRLG